VVPPANPPMPAGGSVCQAIRSNRPQVPAAPSPVTGKQLFSRDAHRAQTTRDQVLIS